MKESILNALSKLYPFYIFYRLDYYKGVLESFRVSSKLKSCGKGTRSGKVEFSHGLNHVSVGSGTVFLPHLFLTTWSDGQITIGDNCSFGSFCHISSFANIRIGDNLLTGKWVSIVDNDHGSTNFSSLSIPPISRELHTKGPIVIGDNVWIGDKATILSNVTIGEGAVIGANAVVAKNVPAYSVVAGNPARIIKQIL